MGVIAVQVLWAVSLSLRKSEELAITGGMRHGTKTDWPIKASLVVLVLKVVAWRSLRSALTVHPAAGECVYDLNSAQVENR